MASPDGRRGEHGGRAERWETRRAKLSPKMTRLDCRPFGLAALVAVAIVGFCVAASAPHAGAEGTCPGSDASSPRFCAQSGLVDHGLVVAAPIVPVASEPESGPWLPVSRSEPAGFPRLAAASPPRAPPSLA